ncbi:putative helicase MOV-10 [Cloeon dipterum]|uniref:putative helicase MOV-10 n=1 Tax=Cloeon dipterum TaxID=197152 RepID=UPI00322006A9
MFPAPVSAISHSLILLRHGLKTLGLDADRNPLRWVNANGLMERDVMTSSLFNLEEADVVASVVSSLFRSIPPNQIMVLAPYRKQVVVLREKLPSTVTTFTVDEVIGQVRPVVDVSLVRSERSGPNAKNHGVGFLKEPNRVNVLICRAKEIVIPVGSRNHFHNSRISF